MAALLYRYQLKCVQFPRRAVELAGCQLKQVDRFPSDRRHLRPFKCASFISHSMSTAQSKFAAAARVQPLRLQRAVRRERTRPPRQRTNRPDHAQALSPARPAVSPTLG